VKRQKLDKQLLTTCKRKYFISFAGLVIKISKGEMHLDSLFINKPYFAFACTRDFFFAFCDYEQISIVQLVAIRRAILQAEDKKHVAWRNFREANMTFEKLLSLLPLEERKEVNIPKHSSYSYDVIKEILPNYDVIY
jgi:hypothetical protein